MTGTWEWLSSDARARRRRISGHRSSAPPPRSRRKRRWGAAGARAITGASPLPDLGDGLEERRLHVERPRGAALGPDVLEGVLDLLHGKARLLRDALRREGV